MKEPSLAAMDACQRLRLVWETRAGAKGRNSFSNCREVGEHYQYDGAEAQVAGE
jgi:hypothetical protein